MTQKNIRRTFKILREVWLNIGVEKVDTHEGVTVKVLLDSSITGMFMDRKIAAKHGFRLQKLDKLVTVRNVDGTNNSIGAITHQVEINVYYKNYIERMRMDVYDLEKTDVILGMPWLQTHNPKINWKTEEVKMMRFLPICEKNTVVKEDRKQRKRIGKKIRAVDQADRDEWKWTMEKKFDDKVELDKEKVRKIVPQKFHKWLKVFEKAESERMPVRKP